MEREMAKERTIKASSIKTKEQWEKAVKSGARIVFDGGYPAGPTSAKKGKGKS